MSIGQTELTAKVAAGTALALLVRLAFTSRESRDGLPPALAEALDDIGDTEGESWLNLIGVALDAGAPFTTERLGRALEALDPVELRRHLLGRYAWSWCTLAGIDDIDAAAAGDEGAVARLLAHHRYYAGHASASLATLLGVDPPETKRRIVTAVDVASHTVLPPDATGTLREAREAAATALATRPLLAAIEHVVTGYRYVPEPEAEQVVLIPHLESQPALVLGQHRAARLIAYRAVLVQGREERLLAFGKALADPKRVEILALVGRGVGRAADIIDATGLTRSTVHHHLGQLRGAGLVALEGNARSYTYAPRREAAAEAAALVEGILGLEEH